MGDAWFLCINIAMTSGLYDTGTGCRFDDRLTGNPKTFAKNAKVAHIDIDPAEIGKIIMQIFCSGRC